MTQKKPILSVANVERKEFNYTIGAVGLKFTLRTDIKSELKTFKELLDRATKDVVEEIAKVGK